MDQNDIRMEIIERFYLAFDAVLEMQKFRGVQTYCTMYGIDKRNFYAQRKDLNRGWFKVSWMQPLVKEYGVNADWLITGRGKMLNN